MPHSYQCWKCGDRVSQDDVIRTTVVGSYGTRGRASTRRVNMCPTCAARRRRTATIFNLVLLVGGVAGIIYYFVH